MGQLYQRQVVGGRRHSASGVYSAPLSQMGGFSAAKCYVHVLEIAFDI